MDTILLRKLTEKSTLDFGQFQGLRVGDLLKLNKKNYLRWVYYNCSMISFIDNVLELIDINDDFRIEKPGIDKEMFKLHKLQIEEHTFGLYKHINTLKANKYQKGKRIRRRIQDSKSYSKGSLQRRNHGN